MTNVTPIGEGRTDAQMSDKTVLGMPPLPEYYANNEHLIEALPQAGENHLFVPAEYPLSMELINLAGQQLRQALDLTIDPPAMDATTESNIEDACALLSTTCHGLSRACGWYHNPATMQPLPSRNTGEQFMLIVSELSEADEAIRLNLQDDKLPKFSGFDVEMADTLIRIFDFAGRMGLDIGGAIVAIRRDYQMLLDEMVLAERDADADDSVMAIVNKISEAMEGDRKQITNSVLYDRLEVEVALAKAVMHIFTMAARAQANFGLAMAAKLKFNSTRADHKPENRIKDGGKSY